MIKATLSKLDNPEDTRTITLSVGKFLELDLADTEVNTRKIKQIKNEEAKLRSLFYGLVQRIRPLLGASVWRWICRSFTTCIPKQRISESRSNASITSATKLYSPSFESISPGNEPVRPRDL
jgi:hypothetical protein